MALLNDISIGVRVSSSRHFTTRRHSTSSPDFPSRFKKGTIDWETLGNCCTHSFNRPEKRHSEKQAPKERPRELSRRSHVHVKVEVSFETAWHPSAQNTMANTALYRSVEKGIREHDGLTVGASPTNAPDERCKEVVEIPPSASEPSVQVVPQLPSGRMARRSWRTAVDGSSREQTTDTPFVTATSRTTSPATSSYAHVKVPLILDSSRRAESSKGQPISQRESDCSFDLRNCRAWSSDKRKGAKILTPSGRLENVFSGRQLDTRMPRETVRQRGMKWETQEER